MKTWQPNSMHFKTHPISKVKIQLVKPIEDTKDFEIHLYVFHLPACLPAIRPTSAIRMDTPFSHMKGDRCLSTNLLYQRTLILSAIACPLVIHSIN